MSETASFNNTFYFTLMLGKQLKVRGLLTCEDLLGDLANFRALCDGPMGPAALEESVRSGVWLRRGRTPISCYIVTNDLVGLVSVNDFSAPLVCTSVSSIVEDVDRPDIATQSGTNFAHTT